MASTYTDPIFRDHLGGRPYETIFEVGSRDALDAIELKREYQPRTVYVFEANPEAIEICKQNLTGHEGFILEPFACWHETGSIKFYPVEYSIPWGGPKERNIGASSCFLDSREYGEDLYQNEITVPAIRLEDYIKQNSIGKIDLLCLDVQGAAFNVLLGLGDAIEKVGAIISEIETKRMYQGETLFPEVNAYLESKGFSLIVRRGDHPYFQDYLYMKK